MSRVRTSSVTASVSLVQARRTLNCLQVRQQLFHLFTYSQNYISYLRHESNSVEDVELLRHGARNSRSDSLKKKIVKSNE